MVRTFDLTVILVSNTIGIFLVAILLASNPWRLRDRTREGKCVLAMICLIVLGCILDPIAYYVDGMQGRFFNLVNFVSNTLLYLENMFMAVFWFLFLVSHMRFRVKFFHKAVLGGFLALGIFTLIVNFFIPIVFEINDANVYERRIGYQLFFFIDYGFMIDSLVLYLIARRRGGLLRMSPVWLYAIPFVVGSQVQAFHYGLSVLSASYAISMSGLLACLQGSLIYMDTQMGCYNKLYLDYIMERLVEKKKKVAVILFNINEFRKINESLGRYVGDSVLQKMVTLLNHAVGESGSVVRYSGDEFMILMNAKNEMAVSVCIARIKKNLADYNKLRDCPCQVSYRVFHSILDFTHNKNLGQVLNHLEKESRRES